MNLKIFTDGGSRGNPGEAAVGVVIFNNEDGARIAEIGQAIGVATNNIAEYSGVLKALEWVMENVNCSKIEFVLDSELVVKQLTGEYKVKDQNLKKIYLEIKDILQREGIASTFTAVRREKNTEADALVNKALDAKLS